MYQKKVGTSDMAQSPFVLTFDVFILLLSIVQTKKLAGRPSCMVTLQVLEVTCNEEPASPGQTPIMERHPTNSICCGQTICTPSTTYKNGSQSRFYNGLYSINENNNNKKMLKNNWHLHLLQSSRQFQRRRTTCKHNWIGVSMELFNQATTFCDIHRICKEYQMPSHLLTYQSNNSSNIQPFISK